MPPKLLLKSVVTTTIVSPEPTFSAEGGGKQTRTGDMCESNPAHSKQSWARSGTLKCRWLDNLRVSTNRIFQWTSSIQAANLLKVSSGSEKQTSPSETTDSDECLSSVVSSGTDGGDDANRAAVSSWSPPGLLATARANLRGGAATPGKNAADVGEGRRSGSKNAALQKIDKASSQPDLADVPENFFKCQGQSRRLGERTGSNLLSLAEK